MSNTLYDEAIADARLLREVAEKNAKQAIIESVTPKIRKFIEDQLIKEHLQNDDQDLEDSKTRSHSREDVILDESALGALMALVESNNTSYRNAFQESASMLSNKDHNKLLEITRKLKEDAGTLSSDDIVIGQELNSINIKENSNMSRNSETLYEVDLRDIVNSLHEGRDDDSKDAHEGGDPGEEADLKELWALLEQDEEPPLDAMPPEDEAPMDDLAPAEDEGPELPPDIDAAIGDLELAIADALEGGAAPEDAEALPADVGGEEEPEALEEMVDVDLNMLRTEIRRMRRLSEGGEEGGDSSVEEMYHEADEDDDAPPEKPKAEGEKGDVQTENRKLRRAVLNHGRNNRVMRSKLDEYRSAVESLREQLTEMNLFNAKLLYVNKMLQNRDVSSTQRRSIIEALDSARSLREVKLLYKSLTESIQKRKNGRTLNESAVRRNLGSASRPTGRSSAGSNESSEINRWAVLAGINNK